MGLKIEIRNLHNEWARPRVAQIGTGSCGFEYPFFFFFFHGLKTRKIIHNLSNPIQNLKITIESTSPTNKNEKKEPELPINPTVKNFFIIFCDYRLNEYVYERM
jgi:hypothetical protein